MFKWELRQAPKDGLLAAIEEHSVSFSTRLRRSQDKTN
jgi:hypothetical protein